MKHNSLPESAEAIFSLLATIRDRANTLILEALAEHGVTDILPAHGAVLHALFKENPLPMGALANAINRKKNTVTSLINTLEARGYCQRLPDPRDARIQLVSLTPQAEKLREIQAAISSRLLANTWNNIPVHEAEICIRTLQSLLANLEHPLSTTPIKDT